MAISVELNVDPVSALRYVGEEDDFCVKCGRSLKDKLCTLIVSTQYVCADDFENCKKLQKSS